MVADLEIRGLTADSREVQPGYLFAALHGSHADGADFIADAVARGAVAVLASDELQIDVANYAGVPAHAEGAVTRAPVVGEVTADRIEIVDCVDLGDSRLVADSTGAVLDDLENRVPRYRFRAELVMLDGRWIVERTAPSLDEPC